MRSVIFGLALTGFVSAAPYSTTETSTPIPTGTPAFSWDEGAVNEYPIRFCNTTETALLRVAMSEAETLALHARDHIRRWGNSSTFYQRYFGKATTGEPAGWFDRIAHADKAGVIFRCDNPDGNCDIEDYGGHWRGSNASDETVICPLSFTSRWPLAGVCGYGYAVASHSTTSYFASDLLHRLYHTDTIGEGVVGHYADTYQEVLALAREHPEEAVRNSATLRYFALDVWAYDIANPGEGCTGEPLPEEEEEEASSTVTSAAAPTSDSAPTSTVTDAPTTTQDAPTECHTHDDGVVHCA